MFNIEVLLGTPFEKWYKNVEGYNVYGPPDLPHGLSRLPRGGCMPWLSKGIPKECHGNI